MLNLPMKISPDSVHCQLLLNPKLLESLFSYCEKFLKIGKVRNRLLTQSYSEKTCLQGWTFTLTPALLLQWLSWLIDSVLL